jgi:hypothetical protein
MQRYLIDKLVKWLNTPSRKPLVLRGARQVGKTWAVRELAKQTGKILIELNLERQRNLATLFESNDPKTILLNLQSALNLSIDPDQSILFLDEIQATPELLASLRWFFELMPELPVIAAGSLLEFVLERHQFSMPVGRINYAFVEPLGFEEFLLAKEETHLLNAIKTATLASPLNEALHNKANQLFKEYLTVGGMPEAVAIWINTHSFDALSEVHNNLINTYKDDFAKYAGRLSLTYLEDTLKAIPRLLTQKTIYSHINSTARHASIKQALDLLTKACLCHKVYATDANGIPVESEINPKIFKTIFIDVGLVSAMLGLQLYQFRTIDDIMLVNKGAIAEQVTGQLLRLLMPSYIEPALYYWTRETAGSSAEVDYLIQKNQFLIPIEVKAGSEGKLRSLHQFMAEKPWTKAVRVYAGQLIKNNIQTKTTSGQSINYELISVPFYLVNQLSRLLD